MVGAGTKSGSRLGFVGVSLVALICWALVEDTDVIQEPRRAAAVVCSGEDYGEDEDGKDGERPKERQGSVATRQGAHRL
ncbi:hypothetical protein HDV64DRAFT_123615 [Trichoderma sp. TUCIM 5745]